MNKLNLILLLMFGAAASAAEDGAWPAPVKDWTAPQAGEHPRLFFRPADLAALKKRAETAEGKVILTRLKQLLDGKDGDTFPTVFNGSGHAYQGNKPGAE